VAEMLARLAATIGYAVSVVVREAVGEALDRVEVFQAQDYALEHAKVTPRSIIVVATQGDGDEEALQQALRTEAGYVAFVASKTKADKVFDYLKAQGVEAEKIGRIRAPAGVDIGARSPEEIAVSILAQIIEVRGQARAKSSVPFPVVKTATRDPVCGMDVEAGTARHRSEYAGSAFYFCCAGCKQAFDREPSRYLATTEVRQ